MNWLMGANRRLYCTVLLLGLSCGCIRSVQPVLNDTQVITDDRFLGNWVSSDGKQSGQLTAGDDHKTYKLFYTDEKGKQANLLISFGKIGDLLIAQSTVDDPAPDASGVYQAHLLKLFSFVIVKQVTPQLVLTSMDADWIFKYVKAHPKELATIAPSDHDLVITATTDDLQAFVLRHEKDDGFFSDNATFVRPGDSTTRPTSTPDSAK